MIPLPKPRGFWDYGLFALTMTGALAVLFWVRAGHRIGWADAALGCAAAVLLVFAIIAARRGEKARWITEPTWRLYVLGPLGAVAWMFGVMYADSYLLHRTDITSNRLWNDMGLAVVLTAVTAVTAGTVWSLRRRRPTRHQSL